MTSSRTETQFAFRWRYALVVFIIALLFRGLYLYEASHQPYFRLLSMDQEYNHGWARCIANDEWPAPYDRLQDQPFFRAPLYSQFLSLFFRVFGDNMLWPALIIQLIIGSISCSLAYGVGAKCFGQRVGIVTGVLCALYWVLAYFDAEFLLPVLLVFFAMLGFFLLFLAAERSSPALSIAAGSALGLFAITRPNILIFFPVAVAWCWWIARSMPKGIALKFVIMFALGCALPPTLVTLRNATVGKDAVVVASQGGVNFYIGNNPRSNGMQAVVPGTRHTWWGGYEDTIAIAEQGVGRKLKPSEVSTYWFAQSLAYIRAHSRQWTKLMGTKSLAFVADAEIPNNSPYEARRINYLSLRVVPLGFAVLLGLFIISLPHMVAPKYLPVHKGPASERIRNAFPQLIVAFIVIYAASIIAFFVTGRYRVPLIPFFAIGAAVTISRLADAVRTRRVPRALMILSMSIAMVAALKIDYLHIRANTSAWAQFAEAQDMLSLGMNDEAVEQLEAIRAARSMPLPELYISLFRAYGSQKKRVDAPAILQAAEEGVRLFPSHPDILWSAAAANMDMHEWAKARKHADAYLALRPTHMMAFKMAFFAAMRGGKHGEALKYYQRALKVDAKHEVVQRMGLELQALAKKMDEANKAGQPETPRKLPE